MHTFDGLLVSFWGRLAKETVSAVRPQYNSIEEKTLQRDTLVIIGPRYPADIQSNADPNYSPKCSGRAPIWSIR